MENDLTLKNIIKRGKEFLGNKPETHFIENTRKTIVNMINHIKLPKTENTDPKTKSISFTRSLVNFFTNKKVGYALLAILIIITTATVGFLNRNPNPQTPNGKIIATANFGVVKILADKEDSLGVDPSSTYSIETMEATTPELIKANITVTPTADFTILKENDNKFKLAFDKKLEADKVYTITLATIDPSYPDSTKQLSWAFQMKNVFRVVSTLPRNKTNEVPTDTGIELTFSHENYSDDYAKYIEITPAVEGRFEKHKRTLSFIPKSLKSGTLYTVKVKQGMPLSGTNEVLSDAFTFQFETKNGVGQYDIYENRFIPEFGKSLSEFTSEEKPGFTLFGIDTSKPLPQTSVSVYKYDSADKFISALQTKDTVPLWAKNAQFTFRYSTENLPKVVTATTQLQNIDSIYSAYMELPQNLGEGFYMIEAKAENNTFQTHFQVTKISAYVSSNVNKDLVWINDLTTKQPVANAKVQVVGNSSSAQSDATGIATFSTDLAKEKNYLKITSGTDQSLVTPLNSPDKFEIWHNLNYCGGGYSNYYPVSYKAIFNENYWSHFYLDRPVYLPTDSVQYWGIAKNKENLKSATNLRIVVTKDDYLTGNTNEQTLITEKPVTANDSAIVIGKLPISNYSVGNYSIKLMSSDSIVNSSTFSVQSYTKPGYEINLKPTKNAIFYDEEVVFNGKASFFEGTPVANLPLRNTGTTEGDLTTDVSGNFSIKFIKGYTSGETINYSVTPQNPEFASILKNSSTQVYYQRVELNHLGQIKNGKSVVKFTVNAIDLSKINADRNENDVTGAPLKNRNIKGTILEYSYDKVETGEYYDFINKRVDKTYRYEQKTKDILTINLITNEKGEATYEFPAEKGKSYQYTATTNDDQNMYTSINGYINSDEQQNSNQNTLNFELKFTDTNKFALGSQKTLTFDKGNIPDKGKSTVLYINYKQGMRDIKVQDDLNLGYTFSERDVPNLSMNGVFFNGRTYFSRTENFLFDTAEKTLTVEVKADKSQYKPQDSVKLSVIVKDKNGKPVESNVNLSMTDAAYIQENGEAESAPLDNLYRPVSTGNGFIYSSHQQPQQYEIAGGCGSTAGGGRSYTPDNALFSNVKTDKNGKGVVSFKLPDNLTSWVVNSQVISTEKLPSAGTSKTSIVVKQPFFVSFDTNDTYLVSDKPEISFRAFGDELKSGQDVQFTLSAPELGIATGTVVSGKAFTPSSYKLPTLKQGSYKIAVTGKSGGLEDTFIRTINVLTTRNSRNNADFTTLTSDTVLKGSASQPSQVTFMDQNRGSLYQSTVNIANTFGDRIDQKVARLQAAKLLSTYFNETAQTEQFDALQYQVTKGGISLFPYSDTDLALSAKMADISPELFDVAGFKNYFNQILNDPKEGKDRVVIALYGLASLDEPVLVPVNQLLSRDDNSPMEKLYLALALAKLGDTENAKTVLEQVIKNNGEDLKPFYRINTGKDQDDILEATALSANLASIVNDEKAKSFLDYIENNNTKDLVVHSEKLAYLQNKLPQTAAKSVKFSYELNGQKNDKELKNGEAFSIQLSPEELTKIKLNNIDGSVGIITKYEVPLLGSSNKIDSNISVTKAYLSDNNVNKDFNDTSLVKVTLNYKLNDKALDGCYQLSDVLPSGLRLVTELFERGIEYDPKNPVSYPYEVNGQKVNFCVYKGETKPIIYYARVVSKGIYISESPIIQSLKSSSSMNVGNSDTITIK